MSMVLENLRGMSCSGTCWPLGGAWFQCRYGGFWMISFKKMDLFFFLIGGQLLYIIVFVLPYINIYPPQVYMCSPS